MLLFPQLFDPFDFHETIPFAILLLGWFVFQSIGLVVFGIVWLTGTTRRELGWRREGLAKALGLGVLGFMLTWVALLPVILLTGEASQPEPYSPSWGRVVMVTFFAFGIPAWVEENLYRGYLQPLLAERVALWQAIVIQAAIFAAAHIGYATVAMQFGWLFLSGLIFGWLRGRDRSLVAPYLAHALSWWVMIFGQPAF